jgi:hypothetical protein
MSIRIVQIVAVTWLALATLFTPVSAAPRADGQLQIEVVDGETSQPIAARMHLKNSRGQQVKVNLPQSAEFGGHFYIDGQLTLPLRRGQYTFELDAGPEYRLQTGHFEIDRHADDTKRIEMKRFANLAEEGWWGGDLDVDRRSRDMPLILRAEGLAVFRIADFGLRISDSTIRNPQSALNIARTPYDWELPRWLAADNLDAIQLIHRHTLRDNVVKDDDEGRPRDMLLYPGRSGRDRWAEAIYYHVLNCGLRIPPSAGSGSGTNDNPVGANRVYVFCGDEFSEERWCDGLAAGQVFVTNGPLLRPSVEGKPPGYVFHLENRGSITLEIGLELATRSPIDYLQIIKNGTVEAEVRLADWVDRKGRLPPLSFEDSGWFLVRAATNDTRTHQFASSGPYYVEKMGQSRISRGSVHFFLDWIVAAEERIRALTEIDNDRRKSLLAEQAIARRFFEAILSQANSD